MGHATLQFLVRLILIQGINSLAQQRPTGKCTYMGADLETYQTSRRALLVSSSLLIGGISAGANAIPPVSRDVDVGGGFDLLSESRLRESDVVYPISMDGLWSCERVVAVVEGDSFQAESAYKALGGGNLKPGYTENFPTQFLKSSTAGNENYVVLDRGFDLKSRTKSSNDVAWTVEAPNTLSNKKVTITTVRRSVEKPDEKGFGFNELYRIDDGLVSRAVEVKRRYRRAFDADGNRVVEGLEIMKTYRVLDGIAGTEMPTSTTKTKLRLTR